MVDSIHFSDGIKNDIYEKNYFYYYNQFINIVL